MENSTSKCMFEFDTNNNMSFVGTLFGFCVIILCVTIIVTICRTPSLHINTNYCMASLNVSDILTAISVILCSSVYFTSISQNMDNKYLFDLFILAMSYSSVYSSGIHLAIMAIDRYIYILKPFYYIKHMTKSRITKILLAVWIFTLFVLITPIAFLRSDKYHKKCIITNPAVEYYITAVVTGCLSFIVVCVCYFRIARVAFQRKKAKNVPRQQRETANAFLSRTNGKAAMKSVQFFIVMFGAYIFCYTPSLILTLLCLLSINLPVHVAFPSIFHFYAHTFINLFIHLNMNKDFRLGMKRQCSQCLCGCCKKN